MALLNMNDYYTPLISLISHAIEAGFVPESNRNFIREAQDPDELLEKIGLGKAAE
ncbi:LOG family protein [Halobacillus rhizosphaerae]|uniref:LOG family protein n=1 Tax=Halobacillus rhizosphaerae TaxID=3064889 RepID=UPI00398A9083